MPGKKPVIYVLLVVVLSLIAIFGIYNSFTLPGFKLGGEVKKTTTLPVDNNGQKLVNRQGQTWGPLPSGDYKFTVSSGKDETIKFLQGDINPPDVHVGDVQTFKIVVSSPNGIATVVAKIETDNGVKEVELKKAGIIAQADLEVNPVFTTDGVNYDIMDQTQFAAATKLKSNHSFVPAASASSGENEVFEGNWTVVDTHNTFYHTTFIATDRVGRTNQLTIAWSDLCGFPNGGDYTLSYDCVISSGQMDGVDNGNLKIGDPDANSRYTLTVQPGGTLIFNPGKSFSFYPLGQLILGSNENSKGQATKQYMYIEDQDQDNHASSSARLSLSSTNSTGYIATDGYNAKRRYTISSGVDCDDGDSDVFTGQTKYFGKKRLHQNGNATHDYDFDCSGSISAKYSNTDSDTPDAGNLSDSVSWAEKDPKDNLICASSIAQTDRDNHPNDFCGGYLYVATEGECDVPQEPVSPITLKESETIGLTSLRDWLIKPAYAVFSAEYGYYYGDKCVYEVGCFGKSVYGACK